MFIKKDVIVVIFILILLLIGAVIYLFFGKTPSQKNFANKDELIPGPTGPQGLTGPVGPQGVPNPTGNTLTVDTVYGDDVTAAVNPHRLMFKTISAALLLANQGDIVLVHAGTYNEKLEVPAGVSIRGINVQSTIIQQLDVTSTTTLLTLNQNCRIEDMTLNLSSSSDVNLIGVDVLDGASINSKLRTLVINVTSTAVGNCVVLGIRSSGISSTSYTSSDLVRSCSINVIASGTGDKRGILVNGQNRLSIRDTNIYARGTATNIVGVETTNVSAVFEAKSSTIFGTLHDINRSSGTIILGSTDLHNNNANGNSFTPSQAPANFQYGTTGNLASGTRYYLLPGTVDTGNLQSESTANPYNVAKTFPLPFTQPSLIIEMVMTFTGTLVVGDSITLNLYRNAETIPALTLTLTSVDGQIKTQTTKSATFVTNDVLRATIETVGNPGGAAAEKFSAIVGYY